MFKENLLNTLLINKILDQALAVVKLKRCYKKNSNDGIYVSSLDDCFKNDKKVTYLRYMDDWIIFSNSRKEHKAAIKSGYKILDNLGLNISIEKTSMGRIEKGFSFLGMNFKPQQNLSLSKATLTRYKNRFSRLYEQNKSDSKVESYVTRFITWAKSGLNNFAADFTNLKNYICKLMD